MSAKHLAVGDRVRYTGENLHFSKRVGTIIAVPTVLSVTVEWDGYEGAESHHFWNSVEFVS